MKQNDRLTLLCIKVYLSITENKPHNKSHEKALSHHEKVVYKDELRKMEKEHNVRISTKTVTFKKLDKIKTPAILFDNQGAPFILAKTNKEKCLIQKANKDKPEVLPYDELSSNWNGKWLDIKQPQSRFDIRWFIPEFLKHKQLLGEIFLFSFVLQILALISPLFFQVVMD
ncbi:cysteine peptidase family C39 domain-containing protein, partial [Photobacterium marinum]|uniref:cysteine peptidase family C39 domain-containing protein n=1 Tax=Photobacterium marinum TaxID=1056511 RepID=UPI00055DD348